MSIRTRKKQLVELMNSTYHHNLWKQAFITKLEDDFIRPITHWGKLVRETFAETNRLLTEVSENALARAAAVEDCKVEYVVVKKSTGEVVDTFDLREDALALIKKHVRQKKAKLALLEGEGVVPFTEEELA